MKAILIPVDFSECSFKAGQYGLELAKLTKAKVIFFHAYFLPVFAPESYVGPEVIEEQEHAALKKLVSFSSDIMATIQESENIEFHNEVGPGLLRNYISGLITEFGIEMVVMGTKGQSGAIKKFLLGSNATSMVDACPVPLLVVPEKAIFRPVQKIVFATTLDNMEDLQIISPLMEITWLTSFEIHFLVVIKKGILQHTETQLKQYMDLESTFRHVPHFLEVIEDDDITTSIDKYIEEIKADILVTIPKKHNFLEKLFNQSITKEMIFHSEIPILCLK